MAPHLETAQPQKHLQPPDQELRPHSENRPDRLHRHSLCHHSGREANFSAAATTIITAAATTIVMMITIRMVILDDLVATTAMLAVRSAPVHQRNLLQSSPGLMNAEADGHFGQREDRNPQRHGLDVALDRDIKLAAANDALPQTLPSSCSSSSSIR